MKKIRIALSIVVLLGTMAVVGVSNSQADFAAASANVLCECEIENPHCYGKLVNNDCICPCWLPDDD